MAVTCQRWYIFYKIANRQHVHKLKCWQEYPTNDSFTTTTTTFTNTTFTFTFTNTFTNTTYCQSCSSAPVRPTWRR